MITFKVEEILPHRTVHLPSKELERSINYCSCAHFYQSCGHINPLFESVSPLKHYFATSTTMVSLSSSYQECILLAKGVFLKLRRKSEVED